MARITVYVDDNVLANFDKAIGLTKRSSVLNWMMKDYIALDVKKRKQFKEIQNKKPVESLNPVDSPHKHWIKDIYPDMEE